MTDRAVPPATGMALIERCATVQHLLGERYSRSDVQK
jgi:hypothetical protein